MTAARFFFFVLAISSCIRIEASSWTKNLEWNKWIDEYASPSPLLAINKTYSESLRISDLQIQSLLNGKTRVPLNRPVQIEAKNTLEFDVFEPAYARRFNVFSPLDPRQIFSEKVLEEFSQETRLNKIQENIYKLIATRKPHELLILQLDAAHALDTYFGFYLQDKDKIRRNLALQRQNEILFVSYPISEDSIFYPQNYYDLISIVDGVAPPIKKISDQFAEVSTIYLSRLLYFLNLKREAFQMKNLKNEELKNFGTLIFMDWTHIREDRVYRKMPQAKSLKELGFKSIRVALEHFQSEKEYRLEDMTKKFLSPEALRLRKFEINFLQKKNPEMARRYLSGMKLETTTAALYEVLKSYEAEKISVSFSGLDVYELYSSAPEPGNELQ